MEETILDTKALANSTVELVKIEYIIKHSVDLALNSGTCRYWSRASGSPGEVDIMCDEMVQ